MAKFGYAVRYLVTAKCKTPFRTGGSSHSTDHVLMDENGVPMIQGTSIAGVLRSGVRMRYGAAAEKKLFGDDKTHLDSPVTVSDGLFDNRAAGGVEMGDRPRLCIEGKTGAAKKGQFFQMNHISAGNSFTFELLLKTEKKDSKSMEQLETILADMDSGRLTLGGQQNNGFGQVELTVMRRCFDLYDSRDRKSWIEDEKPNKPNEKIMLKKSNPVGVIFEVTGNMDSVFVKSGTTETKEDGKITRQVNVAMKERGRYILPGSSVKGCIRNQCGRIASWLGCDELVGELFGNAPTERNTAGLHAGKVRVHEVKLTNSKENTITRTRINRFTGGVMESKLFSEQPTSGKVTITAEVNAKCGDPSSKTDSKEVDAQLGLLFYAMRDMILSLYNIGSEDGIGRGYLTNGTLKVTCGQKCCSFTVKDDAIAGEGNAEIVEPWLKALREKGDMAK